MQTAVEQERKHAVQLQSLQLEKETVQKSLERANETFNSERRALQIKENGMSKSLDTLKQVRRTQRDLKLTLFLRSMFRSWTLIAKPTSSPRRA